MKTKLTLLIAIFFFNNLPLRSQVESCYDLSGIDFGISIVPMGYGMIDGSCVAIPGITTIVDGVDYQNAIYETAAQCEANCLSACLDVQFLDFGPCDAILGYAMLNGECTEISGCSSTINGYDFSSYIYPIESACQLACAPICMDLYGIDFGPCLAFLGYAFINGECVGLSGCGEVVDGIDYSAFIYDSEEECESQCQNTCLDLANLDFGECQTPLGVSLINGECTMVSGCSYEVNGIDYENYFFDSMEECEASCALSDSVCIVEEVIDSTFTCYEVFEPVCGCNGITYQNDCYARAYGGVLYWTEGQCTTGIDQREKKLITFYPNPADNLLTIENPEFEEFRIQLIELSGKIVFQIDIHASKSIDISYIKQGIYLMYIQDSKNYISVEKLIIK